MSGRRSLKDRTPANDPMFAAEPLVAAWVLTIPAMTRPTTNTTAPLRAVIMPPFITFHPLSEHERPFEGSQGPLVLPLVLPLVRGQNINQGLPEITRQTQQNKVQ